MRPIDNIKDLKRLQYYFNNQNERNKMLFTLLLQTGYRIGDLVGLLIGDLRTALEERAFRIREKKLIEMKKAYCRKNGIVFKENDVPERVVPIPIKLAKELKRYIENKSDSDYAFPSRVAGKHITEDTFGKIISKAGKECGIKESICNHTLRKTFVYNVHVNINNCDIKKTQMMIGHGSPETTRIYLGEDMIMFKNAMERLYELYQ